MMKAAAVAAALVGTAVAQEIVVQQSKPGIVDAGSIYFSGVTHRSATISWTEPDKGAWQWPILGYEIQVTSAVTWPEDTSCDTAEDTCVESYTVSVDSTWPCPDSEDGTTLDTVGLARATDNEGGPGCTISAVHSTTATTHTLPGLKDDTMYFFRIRARNHDGSAEWSAASYGLNTHAKPGEVGTPVIKAVTDTTMTILFDTPTTTGTSDCDASGIADKAAGITAYLAGETCNADAATSSTASSDTADCSSSLNGKPCQSAGAGSAVDAFRIFTCTTTGGAACTSFAELTDVNTGMALYPMAAGASGASLLGDGTGDGHDYVYTIAGLAPETDVHVKIVAHNAAGDSATPTAAASSTTLGKPLQPHPPVATSVGETAITLTWDATTTGATGYCAGAADTEPASTPAYNRLTRDFPNEPSLTQACPYDNGVSLTGMRLFASSYTILGESDGAQAEVGAWSDGTDAGGSWEPARRGSLSDDSDGTAYSSSPLSTVLPSGVDDGTWLEIDVSASGNDPSAFDAGSWTVDSLSQDTYYKFKILFTNAVGDSAVSLESEYFLTLEAPVDDLRMHSQPACIYEDGRATRFVATSSGTNVFYKWQMPDGTQENSHDTRSYGSVIAEAYGSAHTAAAPSLTPGRGCQTADCSVMEFVLPSVSSAQDATSDPTSHSEDGSSSSNAFTIAVVGYNTRGQVMLETTYDIQYCGCTDPWNPQYWDQATYHLPAMCDGTEAWDGAAKTAIAGEFQYYQTFYDEETHSAQVIVRVDEGEVNMYASTERIPDPDMSTTYFHTTQGVTSYKVLEIPYDNLDGSRQLYVAIEGVESFSKFSVVATSREFSRGRGETGVSGSTELRRTQLLNIEPQAFEVKTPYYDFFEYYFGKADNDMDIEIKVNCQLGCVNVYTSKIERFPSALRKSDGYNGYWTAHNGKVCATGGTNTGLSGTGATGTNDTPETQYATASFDGVGGVYGMVSFEQSSADSAVVVSSSLKGLQGSTAPTFEVFTSAVGDTSEESAGVFGCGSLGAKVSDLASLVAAPTGTYTPSTIYTGTDTAAAGGDVTLFGESAASDADGISAAGSSILGRSVKITIGSTEVCATIYPDATVTSYVGELSLMHTVRPEETVETCVLETGQSGPCTGTTAERLLFASVQGAEAYDVGAEQVNNEYTIEAKVYRYRVESNLLVPGEDDGTPGVDAEDRRYSVVSIDNFNYYEIELSPAAFGATIHFNLAYGLVELYTSKDKLPTQDVAGHDHLFGDVHAPECTSNCAPCSTNQCTYTSGGSEVAALGEGEKIIDGRDYSISVSMADVNVEGKYVFVGVLGAAPDSSYTISVTEYLFDDHMGTMLTNGEPTAETVVPAGGHKFYTLWVGPQEDEMYVTERSHAGHRTGDLGTDPDTWGIDWTETLKQTWVDEHSDEYDLDVEVSFPTTVTGLELYGSSREAYPSAARGFDVCSSASNSVCQAEGSLTIPHFTFSDKTVYIALHNPTGAAITVPPFTPTVVEMHQNQLTADDPTTVLSCAALNQCSGAGSCVDETCYCNEGFLGDDCSVEAFCTGAGCSGQPAIAITDTAGNFANDDYVFSGTSAATTDTALGAQVEVPYTLSGLPANSKVHVYVDGLPYPAKGANVKYYAGASSASDTVKVFGQEAGVLHTVELMLLSESNIPLGTAMVDFQVDTPGGCGSVDNACSGNGVCHHGYCVCFDGFHGEDCSVQGDDVGAGETFTAGNGYVVYNSELMKQERDEDQYISSLKLAANTAFLALSDSKIQADHAAVVSKLNQHILDNEAAMDTLAASQETQARALHRKRDRITTTIQQMREESKRLKTENQEAYLETVRSLHENQREMQNELDLKRKEHFQNMAIRHDEWVQIKEKNDFKLSQLRTANGPLVDIPDLQERVCTQDDQFQTSCTYADASDQFVSQPGYQSHGEVESVGTCTTANDELVGVSVAATGNADDPRGGLAYTRYVPNPANADAQGYRCSCSYDADDRATIGTYTDGDDEACVKVIVGGEMNNDLYDDIPR